MWDQVALPIAIATFAAVAIITLLIHGIWVAPFIERHGHRSAGFFAHWFLGYGVVIDYLTARKICRLRGIKPRWMRAFECFLLASAIIEVGAVVFVLVGIFAVDWQN